MSTGRTLAVVGSTKFADPAAWPQAEALIRLSIERLDPACCVSGGAEGIDTLFCKVAAEYGFTREAGSFVEHLPKTRRWTDGFQPRNLLIAGACTHLLRLYCPLATTYGSGWTADRAEFDMGKVVRRIALPR